MGLTGLSSVILAFESVIPAAIFLCDRLLARMIRLTETRPDEETA